MLGLRQPHVLPVWQPWQQTKAKVVAAGDPSEKDGSIQLLACCIFWRGELHTRALCQGCYQDLKHSPAVSCPCQWHRQEQHEQYQGLQSPVSNDMGLRSTGSFFIISTRGLRKGDWKEQSYLENKQWLLMVQPGFKYLYHGVCFGKPVLLRADGVYLPEKGKTSLVTDLTSWSRGL